MTIAKTFNTKRRMKYGCLFVRVRIWVQIWNVYNNDKWVDKKTLEQLLWFMSSNKYVTRYWILANFSCLYYLIKFNRIRWKYETSHLRLLHPEKHHTMKNKDKWKWKIGAIEFFMDITQWHTCYTMIRKGLTNSYYYRFSNCLPDLYLLDCSHLQLLD